MKEPSAPALAFDTGAVSSEERLDGSIYESGLVHQISLSNLADEYSPIETSHEVIHALGGAQFKYDDHEAMAKR